MGYAAGSANNFSSRFFRGLRSDGSESRGLGVREKPDCSWGKLTPASDFLQEIVVRDYRLSRSLSAASIQKQLALGCEPPRHAARRFCDLFGITGKADTEVALAARAEGRAGRRADASFVDEPQRQGAGVGKAVD
jgi:hypothetical protein